MGVNKVIYGGKTLVDMTDATVTPNTVLEGYIAYGANGARIVGTASATKRKEIAISLLQSGWDLDNKQTVSVEEVTPTATVIVTGAEDSQPEYDDCGVYCIEQSAGELTFICDIIPTENLTANIAIFT